MYSHQFFSINSLRSIRIGSLRSLRTNSHQRDQREKDFSSIHTSNQFSIEITSNRFSSNSHENQFSSIHTIHSKISSKLILSAHTTRISGICGTKATSEINSHCEWVTANVWISHAHIWMSHAHIWLESWNTNEWVMAHVWMSHGTHETKSHHRKSSLKNPWNFDICGPKASSEINSHRKWVMAHVWMSPGTHINESWHTYEWVTSHTSTKTSPSPRYGVALDSRIDKTIEVSFVKELHKRDYILQKRPIILSILLTVATP